MKDDWNSRAARDAAAAYAKASTAISSGDLDSARKLLGYARRLAPKDVAVALALGDILLRMRDPAAADILFDAASPDGPPEAWLCLAAGRALQGRHREAAAAAAFTLSMNATPDASVTDLLNSIALQGGLPGWCALSLDGVIKFAVTRGEGANCQATLDGELLAIPVDGIRLRDGWDKARSLRLTLGGRDLLGSPLDIRSILRCEGFARRDGGRIVGWARYQGAPNRPVHLRVARADGDVLDVLAERDETVASGLPPLSRPMGFSFESDPSKGPVSITLPNGRHLYGSPVQGSLVVGSQPVMNDGTHVPSHVSVVVPAHGNAQALAACLRSLVATVPPGTDLIVVDDASDDPAVDEVLTSHAYSGRVRAIRRSAQGGFAAAVNTGLQTASPGHVVLLNSDTIVPPGWLERLVSVVSGDIGTVTPMTNDGSIVSYPKKDCGNPLPLDVSAADDIARRANDGIVVDVPTGVGFCMLVTAPCRASVGGFREDAFAQGYGEENDFCLRASAAGWRNVAAAGVFVGHAGSGSFGGARYDLLTRNLGVVEALHPGYHRKVGDWVAADPLGTERRRMDGQRWKDAGMDGRGVLIVWHGQGGGVERVVKRRVGELAKAGYRAAYLLPGAKAGTVRLDSADGGYPNLIFDIPDEWAALTGLVPGIEAVEIHHLSGHPREISEIHEMLGLPLDLVLHDYASFCSRVNMVRPGNGFCGGPEPGKCAACHAEGDSQIADSPEELTRVWKNLVASSRCSLAPSRDAAMRLGAVLGTDRIDVASWGGFTVAPHLPRRASGPAVVCALGGIGEAKGAEVLLACARDASERGLPLKFKVVGHTTVDSDLLATGLVDITGPFVGLEGSYLASAMQADIGFVPSIWPETWCFALSELWEAGLNVLAFDIGAQAERIRATGRGYLVPCGLTPGQMNDALLEAVSLSRDKGSYSGH